MFDQNYLYTKQLFNIINYKEQFKHIFQRKLGIFL